ncbi:MAG: type IV secretory system conjugative DNA transfer family protein [Clostridia bacterium]|nr:type IV secretory system conjugative DNA transfer family protein [Clostridia bacterium]
MNKFKSFMKKLKKNILWYTVVWLVLVILLVAPVVYTLTQGRLEHLSMVEAMSYNFVNNFLMFPITKVFEEAYIQDFAKGVEIFTIIYVLIIFYGISKTLPKSAYDKIEHGSSDWCEPGEQYKILDRKKGIILAKENYLPVDKPGNVNVLIVGGSGSGKSATYSKPNAYQMLGSYVFTDPKGELYDDTAGYLQSHGYDVKVLNLVNPVNSDGYNPLAHIKSELDVDVIANTVVKGQKSESGSSDPYWDDMAEMLLKALIYYLIAVRPPEEQNLASCAEMVRAASNNGGNNLLSEMMSVLPYDHPARMYYKSVELASEKTYSSILSSLQSKLGKFDSKEIAEITSTDTINFEDIAEKKTALYVISSDTHTAYDFLLTIFFSQMIQQLYDHADKNGGKLKIPCYFILDEFANIGRIPDFDKKISTSRSRKISFSVILQNLEQLEAIYEKSHETIIGNCDTHVFLGSNSFKTVEYFSKELGEKTIKRKSNSINRDKSGKKTGKSESDQILARALMTPDELRRMSNDDCIIFEKGLKPIKAKKYWYFKTHMIKEMNRVKLDHNDFNIGDRGVWRKFNPNNPYTDSNVSGGNDLKVESLDDLFDEEIENDNDDFAMPMVEDNGPSELDIQKELEAKFDELFGPLA